jgi:hypothetical protein
MGSLFAAELRQDSELYDNDMIWYIFNCNRVDTRCQQYSTHLHTNSTQDTENGTYITIKQLNIHTHYGLDGSGF